MSTADSPPSPAPSPPESASAALVDQLEASFREQLRRAIGVSLDPSLDDAALAYVDHYLSLVRDEQREAIVSLVAAGAGAWFGEYLRRQVGALWIGDGEEPRRLRLLLEPQFVHLSPVDMAYEAIFSGSPAPDDPRLPTGAALDGAFHLRERAEGDERSAHDWIHERLAEAAPLPEDQYYSLTGRFETLTLILELLADRDRARGREPTRYHLNDYVAALSE